MATRRSKVQRTKASRAPQRLHCTQLMVQSMGLTQTLSTRARKLVSVLRWMGLREQSTVGCFPDLNFFIFHGAGACGVAKTIYKQFCFSQLGLCRWFQ